MGLLEVKMTGCRILESKGLGYELVVNRLKPTSMASNPTSIHHDAYIKRKPTIIRIDFLNIADKFYKHKYPNNNCYNDTALAIAILWEVFEHYGIAEDLGGCLWDNNVPYSTFDTLNGIVRDWCKSNYWKNNIEYWMRLSNNN